MTVYYIIRSFLTALLAMYKKRDLLLKTHSIQKSSYYYSRPDSIITPARRYHIIELSPKLVII